MLAMSGPQCERAASATFTIVGMDTGRMESRLAWPANTEVPVHFVPPVEPFWSPNAPVAGSARRGKRSRMNVPPRYRSCPSLPDPAPPVSTIHQ